MKFKELKIKSKSELEKQLKEAREKLSKLRFKLANRSLKNVREFQSTRKLIARILTLLNFYEDRGQEKNNPKI